MFGFFKKKKKKEERHYDPTRIKITDIRKGWYLDYDFQTWEIVEEFEYDWGNNDFSYEFQLENGTGGRYFLALDEDDGLSCTLFTKLRFSKFPNADEIVNSVNRTKRPPRQLTVEGVRYYRESEELGYFRNIKDEKFQEMIVWEYWDDSEKKVLNVEQWGDDSFEISVGFEVPEQVFSNITPANRDHYDL